MRIGIVALVLVAALGAAVAQQTRAMLSVSNSLVAVRITNPEEQLKRFAPLLTLVDGLMASDNMPSTSDTRQMVTRASQTLKTMVSTLKTLPGVNTKGDLWVVVMPAAKAEGANPDKTPPAPVYIVLPLKDAGAFKVALSRGVPTHYTYAVCGNFAVGGSDRVPPFNSVDLDLPLVTTRQLALSIQVSNLSKDAVPLTIPPMLAALLQPMDTVLQEQQRNVLRIQLGATMTGKDLSLEAFTLPVPGSPLAKSLADGVTTQLPHELAALLPDNLSYVNASDPMLPGSPGTAQTLLRVTVGILGAFLPDERAAALQRSLDRLAMQASQGRALGITAPDATGAATLLGVYRITDAKEARAATQAFIDDVEKSRDVVKGEMWSNTLDFNLTPNAEQINGVSVDLMQVTVTPPPVLVSSTTTEAKPRPIVIPPFTIDCRLAYTQNKLCLAMGPRSREELTALLGRLKTPAGGFTTGEAYQEITELIPRKARSFERVTLLTFCQVMSSWIPPGTQRDQVCKLLSVFPPQQSAILISQEMQPNRLRSEVTMPGEQLDFLYSLFKAAQQLGRAQK